MPNDAIAATRPTTGDQDPIETEGKTVKQVLAAVNERLSRLVPAAEGHGFGYGMDPEDGQRPWPATKWLAVYAVRGGSEGHYVHIHSIGHGGDPTTRSYQNELISFEKFWEQKTALDVAQALTKLFY